MLLWAKFLSPGSDAGGRDNGKHPLEKAVRGGKGRAAPSLLSVPLPGCNVCLRSRGKGNEVPLFSVAPHPKVPHPG